MLPDMGLLQKSVSLYIHIPFCKTKCDYCDFFSIPIGKNRVPQRYLDAVKKEIAWYRKKYKIDYWKTIYIGGGTPSLLTPDQLKNLVRFLYEPGSPDFIPEITVEMNSDDVSPSFLQAARECGVNRLSVGIQALDDQVLQAVHRRGSRESIENALALLRSVWSGRFSVDLISGLPESVTDRYLYGLEKILEFNPDHVSLYALTVEPETPLGRRTDFVSDTDAADRQWIAGRDFLENHGYRQYEVSNFAKPGAESRHNLTYWLQEDYIGCGAGSTGTVYDFDHAGMRWSDTRDVSRYVQFWESGPENDRIPPEVRSLEVLDKETMEFEFFMMGLRLLRGIDAESFRARYKFPLSDLEAFAEGGLFAAWEKKSLARRSEKNGHLFYALTRNGLLFLNEFLENLELRKKNVRQERR